MKIIYGYDSRVMLQQCMVKIENNPNKMNYGFIANNDDVPKVVLQSNTVRWHKLLIFEAVQRPK